MGLDPRSGSNPTALAASAPRLRRRSPPVELGYEAPAGLARRSPSCGGELRRPSSAFALEGRHRRVGVAPGRAPDRPAARNRVVGLVVARRVRARPAPAARARWAPGRSPCATAATPRAASTSACHPGPCPATWAGRYCAGRSARSRRPKVVAGRPASRSAAGRPGRCVRGWRRRGRRWPVATERAADGRRTRGAARGTSTASAAWA